MHLVVPYAAPAPDAAAPVLQGLRLPRLQRLLARLEPAPREAPGPSSRNLPHELALAAAWGWPVDDGRLPLAAERARTDGLDVQAGAGWALLTPCHWQVAADGVSLTDPARLALDEAEARALFDAIAALFAGTGFALHWGAPLRWYAVHDSLAGLPSASLERVIGRDISPWLPPREQATSWRRLQNEAQMLLHAHPINEAREARGAYTVNSLWLSGSGAARPAAAPAAVGIDERLREAWLAHDWAAWAEAWRALDAGPIDALLRRLEGGTAVALTLAGERAAQRFERPRGGVLRRLLRRFHAPAPADVLEDL